MTGLIAGLMLCVSLTNAGGLVSVDQAGYRVKDAKVAYLQTSADSFQVLQTTSRTVVFRGETILSPQPDVATGLTLRLADFSSLRQAGDYVLQTSTGDSSQHYAICDSVFENVYRKIADNIKIIPSLVTKPQL